MTEENGSDQARRFGEDPRGFFEGVYREVAPWDVGEAQPAIVALLDDHPPAAPALDIGCGTGDLALEVGRRGVEVVGVDFAERAIEQAREKARQAGATGVEFVVGDATRPTTLGRRFRTVVDCGFLHTLEADQRDALVRELAQVIEPGGRYYLLAFATEFPVPNTPLEVTREELAGRFSADAGWRIVEVRAAEYLSRFAPVPAVAAVIERT